MSAVRRLLLRQDGVITTAQAVELGATKPWVARRASSGQWQRIHPGVYVGHSGPVLWRTRARAALLHVGPDAALSHDAAGFLHGFLARPPSIIEVSIPADRRVLPGARVRVHRRRTMPEARGVLRAVVPAETLVDLVCRARSADDAVALVCAGVRAGASPGEVLDAVEHRTRVARRILVLDLLAAAEAGIESPLEYRYHRDVEARHRLPSAALQVRQVVGGWWLRADALYVGLGVRVELDGELAHPGGRTDSDVWRDNAVVIHREELTLRYRWRHVVNSCATARQVADALRARGWDGPAHPCSPRCFVAGGG